MTSFVHASLALAVAALAAGCASDPQAAVGSNEPKAQIEYRTGSNIPVRQSRPTTDEERARSQAELEELRRSGGSSQPGR